MRWIFTFSTHTFTCGKSIPMADYIVTIDIEEGHMSDRIRGKQSAQDALAEAATYPPLSDWIEKEVVDEDTTAQITTTTTEHEVPLGDVIN